MVQKNLYIPMKNLVYIENKNWTYTSLNLDYVEILRRGIIIWCTDNIKGRWTIIGKDKFGFEDAGDAIMFRMQFAFN